MVMRIYNGNKQRSLVKNLLKLDTSSDVLGYQTKDKRVRFDLNNGTYVLGNLETYTVITMFKPDEGVEYYYGEFKKDMEN